MPAGHPSTITPTPPPWDSPQVATRKRTPNWEDMETSNHFSPNPRGYNPANPLTVTRRAQREGGHNVRVHTADTASHGDHGEKRNSGLTIGSLHPRCRAERRTP